ncbi:MAG TPA: 16S rRNA (cytosine(1402)-N(4))-methyltransferase, partial [Desulfobacterales bacterium]|nr:16S rRNA (cytosine(1402)-N(4))-methyltransferase [Desulfobacterales bacterium]
MELHQPVLVDEVLRALSIELNPDGVYVVATLGLGGHSLEIVKRLGASGLLIG